MKRLRLPTVLRRYVRLRSLLSAFVLIVSAAAPLRAGQDSGGVDAGDLWRRVRHHKTPVDTVEADDSTQVVPGRSFIVIAPSIGSKPSTGINGGLAGNIAFISGDSSSTRLSSVSGGLKVSEKGQTLSGMKLAIFFPDDRWLLQGDNRFSWTSQNTYPLGGAATSADAEFLKYDQLRVYETVYRTLGKGLFVGGGIDINRHSN